MIDTEGFWDMYLHIIYEFLCRVSFDLIYSLDLLCSISCDQYLLLHRQGHADTFFAHSIKISISCIIKADLFCNHNIYVSHIR